MTELTFTNDRAASRYELRRGDELVSVLDYRDNGRTVALTRAFTNPAHRGHGYAAVITDRAVAEIEAAGDRSVLPVCWYVADWFAEHPERASVLEGAAAR
ncbi:N-acetyltransferase [Microbacterium paludicola]|uniref:N-acetyltransferase n=1 Tax=Microbacterium paludicola TaxID=300019 RepID=A0A4Y9FMJ4_9MICO|nr:GNAT family N-acetyltransferase [Microbacterium paludicola]MBF0817728.1 N-acetyltransferase [Microbacterium paludicola]TFU30062.1 N-acetyltransferase [Microbacterium paludicola]